MKNYYAKILALVVFLVSSAIHVTSASVANNIVEKSNREIDMLTMTAVMADPTTTATVPPARPAAEVISLFSNAYTNTTVGTFSADWDDSDIADIQVAGDDIKKVTFTNFLGIDFSANKFDASAMTHFHMDIWTPDAITDKSFTIKNVDFGGGAAEASAAILTVTQTANGDIPALAQGTWVSIDVPLTAFAGPTTRSDLAQMVISSNIPTVYLDNIYFYGTGGAGSGATSPTVAAPTPAQAESEVISIFSDAYTAIDGVDTNPNWGQTTVTTVEMIASNNTLKMANLNYQGIDFTGNPQDVSGKGFVHLDLWTADATAVNFFLIGANGETPYALQITKGEWVGYDIPLSSFAPVELTGIKQFKFDAPGSPTLYIDNIYFHGVPGSGGAAEPTVAAATPPDRPAAEVISLFSNAYTNTTVETFSATWDDSDVADVVVAGDDVKKVTFGNFLGIDFSSNKFDASEMTHFHMDMWTPSAVADKSFTIKNVDFGGGTAEASAAILTVTQTANGDIPALAQGTWVSIDVPLTAFAGPATRSDLAQMVISSNLGTVYIDNIYFYGTGGGGGGGGATSPTVAAPTPTQAESQVISIFSDAYTAIDGVDTNPNWGQGTVTTVEMIESNNTLKMANLNYQGIDFAGNMQDVSSKEMVHIDLWTANATAVNFFLISEGPVETAYALEITPGEWIGYDIPLSSFGDVDLTKIIQFKFDAPGVPTLYLDNIYFYAAETVVLGNDATLMDIQVSGTSISGFSASTLTYTVELPFGTTDVPAVIATTTDAKASAVVTATASVPGTTTVLVTAEDGTTTQTYSVEFTLAEEEVLGLSDIVPHVYSFDGVLHLVGLDNSTVSRIELYAIDGRMIQNIKYKGQNELQMTDSGVLIALLIDDQGKVLFRGKIISNH